MSALAWVLLGGAVGAVARAQLARLNRQAWSWGTLAANTVAAALLAALVEAHVGKAAALLMGTGLCGALSTWSTLALEVFTKTEGRPVRARGAAYLALTLTCGLTASALGASVGEALR